MDRSAISGGATAVLVESVSLLRVLAAMASLRGLAIPADLSVVLLVDDPDGEFSPSRWASLNIPRNAMGRRAVRMLVALLNDPTGDHERQVPLPCAHTLDPTAAPPRCAAER